MFVTGLISLVAGALSVLAPCVLPFLPVIVGGSLRGGRRRPYVIAASLTVSLILFTLLLKATTAFISIDPRVWTVGSGVLVILLGLSMLFPDVWAKISTVTGLDRSTHSMLAGARSQGNDTIQAIGIGAALGPVFSSCSPTYAWVIATVLPAEPVPAMIYLSLYCLGMAGLLLAIALGGRTLISKLAWATNPRGWFQRTVAILMIVVGAFVATGLDKSFQTWAADKVPSFITSFERSFLEKQGDTSSPKLGSAPEFAGIESWINSDPLTMAELKGKVVLVDFWTYSCINCVRTQPYLNDWYEKYRDDGLEIVGVHAPEFAFEKVEKNVRRAVEDANIAYPVALDNDFRTWEAFRNRYWPAKYLIDRDGQVRYTHIGEGDYEETEEQIRALLGVVGENSTASSDLESSAPDRSPETYLGVKRARNFTGTPYFELGRLAYTPEPHLAPDQWTLGGTWEGTNESSIAAGNSTLSMMVRGSDVFLVMDGPAGATVTVTIDGQPAPGGEGTDGVITLDGPRMYHLAHLESATDGSLLHLACDDGVSVHAFTFG